jgi:hypothetical protein
MFWLMIINDFNHINRCVTSSFRLLHYITFGRNRKNIIYSDSNQMHLELYLTYILPAKKGWIKLRI